MYTFVEYHTQKRHECMHNMKEVNIFMVPSSCSHPLPQMVLAVTPHTTNVYTHVFFQKYLLLAHTHIHTHTYIYVYIYIYMYI